MVKAEIAVAGTIVLDIFPQWSGGSLDSLVPGHLIEMNDIRISTGGAVSNTGVDLNRLGIKLLLIGKIGNDYFGRIALDILKRENEDMVRGIIIDSQAKTSYTIVLSPPETDRIFLHYPGSNDTFSEEDIPYDKLTGVKLFHFGYPPLMRRFYIDGGVSLKNLFKRIKDMEIVTSLDMAMPDPNTDSGKADWDRILREVLPYVDIFLPSIDELLYMVDRQSFESLRKSGRNKILNTELLDKISNYLISIGAKIVAIKIGDQGLYLRTVDTHALKHNGLDRIIDTSAWGNRQLLTPCFKTTVVGTTGSGDATIAGFIAKFIEGTSPEEVIKTAVGVGAFSVEALDATSGVRPLEEVSNRIKSGWDILPIAIAHEQWTFDGVHKLFRGPRDKVFAS